MSRPYNGNPWFVNSFRVASQVKHERWIVDFQQAPGILCIAGNDHIGTHLSNAVDLSRGQLKRLAQRDALRRGGRQTSGLKRSERCGEQAVYAAKALDQSAASARPDAWRE